MGVGGRVVVMVMVMLEVVGTEHKLEGKYAACYHTAGEDGGR